jgi:anti-sigma28 factor (negative regulator of flagellin synthesis)
MSEFMNIGSFNRNFSPQRLDRPQEAPQIQPAQVRHGRSEQRDHVELSEHARHLAGLRNMSDVRIEKIEAAQAMISSGKYETSEVLEMTAERMLADDLI